MRFPPFGRELCCLNAPLLATPVFYFESYQPAGPPLAGYVLFGGTPRCAARCAGTGCIEILFSNTVPAVTQLVTRRVWFLFFFHPALIVIFLYHVEIQYVPVPLGARLT